MLMDAKRVAKHIVKAVKARCHIVVIDWRYRLLTALWRRLPKSLWRRLPKSLWRRLKIKN